MKSAKRIQKQLTTEYTEHTEQTLFRGQDYSTTDTHGLTRICSGGTNTRQYQGSPQPYLSFFAAKSVWIRTTTGHFLVFCARSSCGLSHNSFHTKRLAPRLWNPVRVLRMRADSLSQGGFATLGFDMESLQDSTLSVLSAFRLEDWGTGELANRQTGELADRQTGGLADCVRFLRLVVAPLLQVYPWLKTGLVAARMLQVFRGGKTRR